MARTQRSDQWLKVVAHTGMRRISACTDATLVLLNFANADNAAAAACVNSASVGTNTRNSEGPSCLSGFKLFFLSRFSPAAVFIVVIVAVVAVLQRLTSFSAPRCIADPSSAFLEIGAPFVLSDSDASVRIGHDARGAALVKSSHGTVTCRGALWSPGSRRCCCWGCCAVAMKDAVGVAASALPAEGIAACAATFCEVSVEVASKIGRLWGSEAEQAASVEVGGDGDDEAGVTGVADGAREEAGEDEEEEAAELPHKANFFLKETGEEAC